MFPATGFNVYSNPSYSESIPLTNYIEVMFIEKSLGKMRHNNKCLTEALHLITPLKPLFWVCAVISRFSSQNQTK